jgi:endonuclease/exonuclease/phosphatase family metal-dependent hydrolase
MKHFLNSILKKFWHFLLILISWLTFLAIILAFLGQIVRDPTVEWALLMYIPLVPLGIGALIWDLFLQGRSLPGRFGLLIVGLIAVIWGCIAMIGMGAMNAPAASGQQLTVLHWNVRWGGRGQNGWASIRHDIIQQHPDIIIISETPTKDRLNQLIEQLGNQWTMVMLWKTRSNPLAVASSWPLSIERIVHIRDGVAMVVVVMVEGQPLRILAVDGKRNMSDRLRVMSRQVLPRWRKPMLESVTHFLERDAQQEKTIDLIAGDFNALSISLGFKPFTSVGGGYYLASQFSTGWRGTWKSYLPLYDIDHVWVHKRFKGLRTELITNWATDHRGQRVEFQW